MQGGPNMRHVATPEVVQITMHGIFLRTAHPSTKGVIPSDVLLAPAVTFSTKMDHGELSRIHFEAGSMRYLVL